MRGWTRGGLAKQVQAKNAGINVVDACQQQLWHSAWSSICGALFRGGCEMPWRPRLEIAHSAPQPHPKNSVHEHIFTDF